MEDVAARSGYVAGWGGGIASWWCCGRWISWPRFVRGWFGLRGLVASAMRWRWWMSLPKLLLPCQSGSFPACLGGARLQMVVGQPTTSLGLKEPPAQIHFLPSHWNSPRSERLYKDFTSSNRQWNQFRPSPIQPHPVQVSASGTASRVPTIQALGRCMSSKLQGTSKMCSCVSLNLVPDIPLQPSNSFLVSTLPAANVSKAVQSGRLLDFGTTAFSGPE